MGISKDGSGPRFFLSLGCFRRFHLFYECVISREFLVFGVFLLGDEAADPMLGLRDGLRFLSLVL